MEQPDSFTEPTVTPQPESQQAPHAEPEPTQVPLPPAEPPHNSKTYGLSPYAKALMRSLGGNTQFMSKNPKSIKNWKLDRPDSLLELIPDKAFTEQAELIPNDFLNMTERQLLEQCPSGTPGRVERRVRILFWDEYERAATDLTPMDLNAVVAGSGARNWPSLAEHISSHPALFAWFLAPPASYKVQMKEAVDLGLSRLLDILEVPIMDPETGAFRPAVAALILQAFKLVDIRVNGMPTQRIAQFTAHQTIPASEPLVTAADLDRKLAELEHILSGTALEPPRPKPVEQLVQSEVLPAEPMVASGAN